MRPRWKALILLVRSAVARVARAGSRGRGIAGLFFAGYGLARFAVEFVRQPDAQFVTARQPAGPCAPDRRHGPDHGADPVLPMIAAGAVPWCCGARRRWAASCASASRNGPMTLADYMAECLLHPAHGYYTTREPFGRAGDFITAPEISQMFGELLGLCLAQSWLTRARPPLHAGRAWPRPRHADGRYPARHPRRARLSRRRPRHLVEASPRLREIQRATLGDHPVTG
jgi:hypothetical protein